MFDTLHQEDAPNQYGAAAAAHIYNIYIPADDPPAIKFQKIANIISEAIRLAVIEAMSNAVKPTEN